MPFSCCCCLLFCPPPPAPKTGPGLGDCQVGGGAPLLPRKRSFHSISSERGLGEIIILDNWDTDLLQCTAKTSEVLLGINTFFVYNCGVDMDLLHSSSVVHFQDTFCWCPSAFILAVLSCEVSKCPTIKIKKPLRKP